MNAGNKKWVNIKINIDASWIDRDFQAADLCRIKEPCRPIIRVYVGATWQIQCEYPPCGAASSQITLSSLVYYSQHVACMRVSVGELQVSQITHRDSLLISEISDEILRRLGVHYDAE